MDEKEVQYRNAHHPWCNFFFHPREGCMVCDGPGGLWTTYPLEPGMTTIDLMKKYFPGSEDVFHEEVMAQDKILKDLESFRVLKRGWDSYDGSAISPKAIEAAKDLVRKLGSGWTPVPGSDGSVQLERHADGLDIEIYINEA